MDDDVGAPSECTRQSDDEPDADGIAEIPGLGSRSGVGVAESGTATGCAGAAPAVRSSSIKKYAALF